MVFFCDRSNVIFRVNPKALLSAYFETVRFQNSGNVFDFKSFSVSMNAASPYSTRKGIFVKYLYLQKLEETL